MNKDNVKADNTADSNSADTFATNTANSVTANDQDNEQLAEITEYSHDIDCTLNTPAVSSSVVLTSELAQDQNRSNVNASTPDSSINASTDHATDHAHNSAPTKPRVHPLDYETEFQQNLQTQLPRVSILLLILVMLMAISSLGSNAFIPAMKEIASEFHASYGDIQSFVALYFIGSGIGQFVWGPVADSFGRKRTLLICVVLGVITNLMFAMSLNYYVAVVSRLLQGFSLTGLGMLATVTLKDSFSQRRFMTYSNMLVTVFMFVPAFSPFFGGYVYILLNWRAIFYILILLAIIATTVFIYRIPETLDPTKKQPFNLIVIIKNYFSIIINPVSLLLITINVVMSIATFSLPTLLPGVLIGYYNIAPQHVGYFPLTFVIFVIIGLQVNQYLLSRKVNPLKIAFYGSLLQVLTLITNVVVALGLFGVPLNIFTIMIPLNLNILFNGLQIGNLFSFYLMNYGRMIGTATSLLTCLRLLVPGVVLVWLAHVDAHYGASLLIFNTIFYLVSFIGTMIYVLIMKNSKTSMFR